VLLVSSGLRDNQTFEMLFGVKADED
jgi:hypothetical protein